MHLSLLYVCSWGFPHSSVGKESTNNAGDPGSIPGWGRSPGQGIGYPLQYSWASLVAQLVCLQCRRPGFDPWVGKIPWRRERLPTPGFWPEEFHGLFSPWDRKELDRRSEFHFTSLPFLIRDAHTLERAHTLQPLNTLFPTDHFGCL